jgi:serine/threonine protein kinase
MPFDPGTRLGPYEILELAGAGGIGEVYRARDTRLRRTVALKVASSRISTRHELTPVTMQWAVWSWRSRPAAWSAAVNMKGAL